MLQPEQTNRKRHNDVRFYAKPTLLQEDAVVEAGGLTVKQLSLLWSNIRGSGYGLSELKACFPGPRNIGSLFTAERNLME